MCGSHVSDRLVCHQRRDVAAKGRQSYFNSRLRGTWIKKNVCTFTLLIINNTEILHKKIRIVHFDSMGSHGFKICNMECVLVIMWISYLSVYMFMYLYEIFLKHLLKRSNNFFSCRIIKVTILMFEFFFLLNTIGLVCFFFPRSFFLIYTTNIDMLFDQCKILLSKCFS